MILNQAKVLCSDTPYGDHHLPYHEHTVWISWFIFLPLVSTNLLTMKSRKDKPVDSDVYILSHFRIVLDSTDNRYGYKNTNN